MRYLFHRENTLYTASLGPYTFSGGLEANAWFNLGGGDPSWADVQLTATSTSVALDPSAIYVPTNGLTKQVCGDIPVGCP